MAKHHCISVIYLVYMYNLFISGHTAHSDIDKFCKILVGRDENVSYWSSVSLTEIC